MRTDQRRESAGKSPFRMRSTGRAAHASMVYIFALTLVVASISRLPFLDQLAEVKIGIFGAELLSAMLLFLVVRQREAARTFLAVAAFVIIVRFAFGFMLASFTFGQSFESSVQESRFGLMFIVSPIAFLFLKESSNALLIRFISCYMLVLLTLDILIYFVFNADDLLILGLRTENRFFCSILAPFVATVVLLIRQHLAGANIQRVVLAITFGMLLHSILVTTSRAETLLTAGLLSFVFYKRWPVARWTIRLTAIAVILLVLSSTISNDEGVAGRDYSLAVDLIWKALPFGFGAVIDPTARTVLDLPENFFFSDYGVLLYVLRYGLLGVIIAFSLLLLWVHFALSTRRLKGNFLLAVPILIYLTIIPLLDYGSLNGGFLLALMWLVPQQITYSSLRSNAITNFSQFQ